MGVTLFIGNGINRLETQHNYSWEDVLRDLAQKVGGQDLLELKDDKPFPLIYETMQLKLPSNGRQQDLSLKKHISISLQKMMPNLYHHKFLSFGVKNIITTNYDYCFERTEQKAVEHVNTAGESKYSAFRRTKASNTYVWHIHGEIDKPDSILMGYEQYGGYLQKIRNYLLPLRNKTSKSVIAHLKKKFDGSQTKSWVDLFLRDDVHTLGFSMDYSEIDIWWLLVFKAQCKTRYSIKPGRTFYYHWSTKESNRDKAKLQLLEALGVVVYSKYGDDFKTCYDDFKL
jgi:hypothetical protein